LSRTVYSKKLSEPSVFHGIENDRNVGIERLLADGTFCAAYPLHEDYETIDSQKNDRLVK
jgi:hypothetical protein